MVVSDNVRMVEPRNHLHLVNDGLLSVGVRTVQLFDGDLTLRNIFPHKEHRAKTAFTQLPLELVNIIENARHDEV